MLKEVTEWMDIFAFFLILGKNIQSFNIKYHVSYRIFIDMLHQIEKISLYF